MECRLCAKVARRGEYALVFLTCFFFCRSPSLTPFLVHFLEVTRLFVFFPSVSKTQEGKTVESFYKHANKVISE